MYDELENYVQEEQVRKGPRGYWLDRWGCYVELGTGIRFSILPPLFTL